MTDDGRKIHEEREVMLNERRYFSEWLLASAAVAALILHVTA